jgi:hypothetical protein
MATSGGPNLVKSGLVLSYDAANIKSFRGEPTTNIAGTDSARTIQFHNQGAYGNAGTTSNAPEKGIGWKKITITNRGNNFRIAQMPYVSNTSGVVYSYSLEVDMGLTSGYYWRIDGSGGYGALTIVDNKVQTTITPGLSGSFALFLNHNTTGVSGISETIYYRFYQVEQKPYSTFFTETSRGTTVVSGGGLIDQTGNGNNGEIINGVMFNSSNLGSLMFDGSDDTILTTLSNFNNNTTWVAWANRTSAPNYYNMFMGRLLPYFGVTSDNGIIFSNIIGGSQQTVFASSVSSSGIWLHLSFTTQFNGSNTTMRIYLNGQSVASNTFSGGQGNGGYGFFEIGDGQSGTNWYPFNGRVASVQIYDRTLTDAEVLQNFNSTRGRFRV